MKKNKKIIGLAARQGLFGYQFLLPFIIGYAIIFLPSLVQAFIYSFQDVNLTSEGLKTAFLGIENFKRAFFSDTEFRVILLEALQKMVIDVIVITMFSFFIAIVLNQKFMGRSLARTIFFLPVILSTGLIASVEAGDMMMGMYASSAGNGIDALSQESMALFDLEMLLKSSAISPWLIDIVMGAVDGISELVNSSGVQILIFLAGLQAIPASLFESSKVEGATMWETFWKITFPIMRPIILVNCVYTIVDTYTRPSYGILSYVENFAYNAGDMGYSSALSVIYFIVVIIFMLIVWLVVGRKMDYID